MGAGWSGSEIAATLVSSPTGVDSASITVPGVGSGPARTKPEKARWTPPREWMRSTISWPR